MKIAVTFTPPAMTSEQYDAVVSQLDNAGAFPAPGRLYHVCFGPRDKLRVGEVWESQEAFDRFGDTIEPVFRDVGLDPGQPEISIVHNILI